MIPPPAATSMSPDLVRKLHVLWGHLSPHEPELIWFETKDGLLLREATPRGNGVSDARARILYHTLVGPMADEMVGARHHDDHRAVRYLLQEFGRWVRGRRVRAVPRETP